MEKVQRHLRLALNEAEDQLVQEALTCLAQSSPEKMIACFVLLSRMKDQRAWAEAATRLELVPAKNVVEIRPRLSSEDLLDGLI